MNEEKKDSTETEVQSALSVPPSRDTEQEAVPMQNPEKEFKLSLSQLTKGVPVHPEKAEDILLNE